LHKEQYVVASKSLFQKMNISSGGQRARNGSEDETDADGGQKQAVLSDRRGKHRIASRRQVLGSSGKLRSEFESPPEIKVKEDRVRQWLAKGAKPTVTVSSLLLRKGIEAGS